MLKEKGMEGWKERGKERQPGRAVGVGYWETGLMMGCPGRELEPDSL